MAGEPGTRRGVRQIVAVFRKARQGPTTRRAAQARHRVPAMQIDRLPPALAEAVPRKAWADVLLRRLPTATVPRMRAARMSRHLARAHHRTGIGHRALIARTSLRRARTTLTGRRTRQAALMSSPRDHTPHRAAATHRLHGRIRRRAAATQHLLDRIRHRAVATLRRHTPLRRVPTERLPTPRRHGPIRRHRGRTPRLAVATLPRATALVAVVIAAEGREAEAEARTAAEG